MCRRNVFRRRVRSELGALLVTETGSEWNQVESNRFICRCSMKRDLMTLCVDTDTVHAVCVCVRARLRRGPRQMLECERGTRGLRVSRRVASD